MTLLARALSALTRAPTMQRPPQTFGMGMIGQSLTPATMLQQMTAYGSVGWLFAVVSRIAEATGRLTWTLYRSATSDKRTEVAAHPAAALWARPNPFTPRSEFLEISQQHLELVGEAWWVLLRNGAGKVVEMWPLRPDRMRPVPHPEEYISGYLYTAPGSGQPIPLSRDDVIMLRRPNPLDPYRGWGVVQALMADLEGERYAAQWNRNFFYNSAEPGGIIELTEHLSQADYEEFVLRWREQHRGVANAHRVAVLERGHWVDRKLSQRDMQFKDLRAVNRDVILGAFGFPQHMLGISESVNRANAEAAEVMFGRWVVYPRAQKIKEALNEWLLPSFGAGLEFGFDDPTPGDRALLLQEAQLGYQAGVLTQNEARRRLGEDDVPGGDGFFAAPAPMGAGSSGTRLLAGTTALSTVAKLPDDSLRAEHRRIMERAWTRRLAAEADAIADYLGQFKTAFPVTKLELSDADGYDWDWWERHGEQVMAEMTAMFSASFTMEAPELGPTLAQRNAVAYARDRAGNLLRLDGDVSMTAQTRERVRELVADTIERGDSLRTLQQRLRADAAFSRERAELVARTETATALGDAKLQAGTALGRDEKRWVTQGDELVEADCRRNEGVGWIPIRDAFPTGLQTIPQHPRCRCTLGTRNTPLGREGVPALPEARCPGCHRLLARDVNTATLHCGKCKAQVRVQRGLTTFIGA